MLSEPHQSSARASAGALGCARAVLLSISLSVLACAGSAYAGTITLPAPAAAAQSEAGVLPAAGAAVQPPASAAASATSAVVQSVGTIVPATAPSSHPSGHTLGAAADAAVQAAAAPKGSSAGGPASKLLASARNGAPAASEVVVQVGHAVSRTLAPAAGAARVLKAVALTASQTPAKTLADVLAAASRHGGHLVAPGREAILRVLRPATPAAAAAIQRAAEALAGARARAPSLPLLPPLWGLGDPPIPLPIPPLGALPHSPTGGLPEQSVVEALGAYLRAIAPGLGPATGSGGHATGGYQAVGAGGPEAGLFDPASGAAAAPTREVLSGTVWASRTPCTIAGAEEQITQRCGAAPLPVVGPGSTPFVALAADLPSRGPPVETHLGGAHASARAAGAPGGLRPANGGAGGTSGSASGALGSPFPTLLLLAGLLLVGIPRLTRRLSLARQRCIAAPFALIPERPG
jgi:hypothetical protein